MDDLVLIYLLIDPTTIEIRYVGKTINLPQRLARHKRDAFSVGGTSIHRNAWLRGLYSKGLAPIVQIVDTAASDNWGSVERYYIQHLSEAGYNLTNMTPGGEGCTMRGSKHWNYGKLLASETKAKISSKAKDRWANGNYDFHKVPMAEKRSPEQVLAHKARMHQYNKTKVVTPSTRIKLSAHQSRAIVLVDANGAVCYTFPNANAAAVSLGCKRSNVNNRRRTGGKLLRKYTVHYKDEYYRT